MKVTLLAAIADNGVIGRAGALPWRLPDDLRRFKALTLARPVLMGRRTFESIGKPLPGRRNLVLTHAGKTLPVGAETVDSMAAALAICVAEPELCVIGGANVYAQALPHASHLELTRVHATVDGDVRFPDYDATQWRELERVAHPADERHIWAMTFVTLERIAGA